MKRIIFALVGIGSLAGAVGTTVPVSGQSDGDAAPIYGIKLPQGYRDWRLISVKRLTGAGGKLKQLRAQLGNDIAIAAFREGKLPFPDGSIIAALHWNENSSDFDNQALAAGFPDLGLELDLCWVRHERSIHGQGLEKIRCVRRLGIRRLHERQTWRSGAARKVLPLPPACKRSRLRFHSLRAYALN